MTQTAIGQAASDPARIAIQSGLDQTEPPAEPSTLPPLFFHKLAPADRATDVPTDTVVLSWSVLTDTISYGICVQPINPAAATLLTECGATLTTTETAYTLTALSPGTAYRWQIIARVPISLGPISTTIELPADNGAYYTFSTVGMPVPPGGFSKLAPANGTTGITAAAVALSWEPSANAISYKVCLSTANSTCNTSWFETRATSATILRLQSNRTYYWQVKAFNHATPDSNEANGGAWWSFTTNSNPVPPLPGPFHKLTPPNQATGVPTDTVVFSWQILTGTLSYGVCVLQTNPSIATPATDCTAAPTTTETVYTMTALAPGATYRWQIIASVPISAGWFTATIGLPADNGANFTFTTAGAPPVPGAFSKLSPDNGATGVATDSLTLAWEASANADTYKTCLSTTDGACPYGWTETRATTVTVPHLRPNTTYYWQVKAHNQASPDYVDANGGTWWSFTTGDPAPAPGAFSKLSPDNGATGVATDSLTLAWEASANAEGYKTCLSTSGGACASGWMDTRATTVTIPHLRPNTTYYWQVKARNQDNPDYVDANAGTWWSFTTGDAPEPALPGPFFKQAPPNQATDVPTHDVTLAWTPSANASSYWVCVGLLSPSSCNIAETGRITGTSYTLPLLRSDRTYYWRVRAVNEFGITWADTGTVWSFTTVTATVLPPPEPFRKTAPVDGAANVPVTGTVFSWEPSANAMAYELCFSSGHGSCGLTLVTTGTTYSTVLPIFRPGTIYAWQVYAINRTGRTAANDGERWMFTTANDAGRPGDFGKTSPADGAASVNPTGVNLSWQPSARAWFYHICIGLAEDSCMITFATQDTQFSHPMLRLLPNTQYFWQVKAFNASGFTAADGGAGWSFTTASGADPVELLALYALAFDNNSTSTSDLSSNYRPAIHSIISATLGHPEKTAVILADLDEVGDTHILVVRNGVVRPVFGLPTPAGVISPTLREYDMADGATLGGFIKWARLTYHPSNQTVFSYIGHGAALFPETDLGNVFGVTATQATRNGGYVVGVLPTHIGVHPDYTDAHPASMLSPYDLAEALSIGTDNGASPIDVVDIVHCFAATIEEMYPLGNFALATTASPNYAYFDPRMPGAMLSALGSGMTADAMASAIVGAYDAMLPAEEHPRILVAVDNRNGKLAAIKAAWDTLSRSLVEQMDIDESTTRLAITAAYTGSAKYDTTLCKPQDWQLAPPDALSDMSELASQMQVQFGQTAIGDQAAAAQAAIDSAVITTVVKNGSPWFATVTPAPVWTFTGKGIAIYSDFQGMSIDGQDYLSYQINWYTDTVSAANPHPYSFIARDAGGSTWADVLHRFWAGTPYQTAACLPELPPADQAGELAVARILGPVTRTVVISAPVLLQAVIRVDQVTVNPLVRFTISSTQAVVYSTTIGAGYLLTGSHRIDAGRDWRPTATGAYTLEVRIDPDNRISETDKLDNVKTARINVVDDQVDARPVITAGVAGGLQWLPGPTATLAVFQQEVPASSPLTRLIVQVYQYERRDHPLRLEPIHAGTVRIESPSLPLVDVPLPSGLKPGPVVFHVWGENGDGISTRAAEVWFNLTPPDTPIAEGEEHDYVFKGEAGASYDLSLDVPDSADANIFAWYPYNHLAPDVQGVSFGSDSITIDAPVDGLYLVVVRGETAGGTTYSLSLTPNLLPSLARAALAPASIAAPNADAVIPSERPSIESPIPDLAQDTLHKAYLPMIGR